jgi:hypothetical protein
MMRFCVFMAGEAPAQIEMCVKTIRHHHRSAIICHMTDEKTQNIDGVNQTWRLPWDGDRNSVLMLRMNHLAGLDDSPTVLLDSDTLVCASLANVFDLVFDVALTRRDKPKVPYNFGVMFSRKRAFWSALRDRFAAMPPDKAWMNEQIALRDEAQSGNWDVRELPCSEWNASEDFGNAKVRHYKGGRKELMAEHFWHNDWQPQLEAA